MAAGVEGRGGGGAGSGAVAGGRVYIWACTGDSIRLTMVATHIRPESRYRNSDIRLDMSVLNTYPDISKLESYYDRKSPGYSKSSLTWEFATFLIDGAERLTITLPSRNRHDLSQFLFDAAHNGLLHWNVLRRDCNKAREFKRYSDKTQTNYFGREHVLTSVTVDSHHRLKDRNIIKYLHYYKQDRKCKKCGEVFSLKAITIDHKFPKSKGGSNSANNIQLMCNPCNATKADS